MVILDIDSEHNKVNCILKGSVGLAATELATGCITALRQIVQRMPQEQKAAFVRTFVEDIYNNMIREGVQNDGTAERNRNN